MSKNDNDWIAVAGNGLLDRRLFLQAGATGALGLLAASADAAGRPEWSRTAGAGMDELGEPSMHEAHVRRTSVSR